MNSGTSVQSAIENTSIFTALSSSENGHDKAIIVHVFFSQDKNLEDLAEFRLLAQSAQVDILQTVTARRSTPQAKYFVGQGKAEEIAELAQQSEADVILVNHQVNARSDPEFGKLMRMSRG